MKSIFLGAAIAALIASPTIAADLMIDTPPAPPVVASGDWSGPYVGIFAGAGAGTTETGPSGGPATGTVDYSGGLLGVTAGVNMQMDSLVLGIEGDIAWSNVSGEETCDASPTFDCGANFDWIGTLRGRAGFAMDSVLFYATAGIAATHASATVTPIPALATGEFDDTVVGWTAGIGAEFKLADNISLKAEYDYMDFGTTTAPGGTITSSTDEDLHPTMSTVKLGLNLHF